MHYVNDACHFAFRPLFGTLHFAGRRLPKLAIVLVDKLFQPEYSYDHFATKKLYAF